MGRESSYGKARPNDTNLRLPKTTPYYKRNEPHICSFFIRGECTRGAECAYRHEISITDELSQQNIKDRFHRVYEPVALKQPNNMPILIPPEDESIRTLYVGGIYARVSEQDLRDHFYAYGELESVRMVPQRACAYVTFTTRKGAEKAAKELSNNLAIKGLQLKLMWGRLKAPKAEREVVSDEERQQSIANSLLAKAAKLQQYNQMIQPPGTAASQVQPPPLPVHYVNNPPPLPQLGRDLYASTDPQRTGAVIASQEGSAVSGSDDLVAPDDNSAELTEELPRIRTNVGHCGVGINASVKASEGMSEVLPNPSVSGETRTMPSGGAKRSSDPLEELSPQEMRERVMKRKKGSSTSTSVSSTVVPPVSPPGFAATMSLNAATLVSSGMDVATQVGSAAVGVTAESSVETPLMRFVTSFPRDFLLQKSGVTTLWPDADTLLFPGPMNLLEKKSDLELVNEITEMTLQTLQAALMSRRRLLAQLGQQDVWRVRLAEAEAAEARMSSQLREAEAQIHSLKEAVAAAEARAATAVEARKAREALLMTADVQLREMTEKMRRKDDEIREERKDAASSAALRARAKLMREFLDGKSSSWDPQAEIDFYVAHIGEEADLVSKDTSVSTIDVDVVRN